MIVSWCRELCLQIGDVAGGWLLYLPRDLSLVLLSALTAMILLLLRRLAANQAALRSVIRDDRRLRRLARRSKRQRDERRMKQLRRTRAEVARRRIRIEIFPAVLSLLPVAVIATWAAARFAYYPPQCDTPTALVASTPVTDVGKVVHLVPDSDFCTRGGWMREVTLDGNTGPRRGMAAWVLSVPAPVEHRSLQIRSGATTVEHPVRFGHTTYTTPLKVHDGDWVTRLCLTEYCPFSVIPHTRWLPAWSIGYLCLTALFFFAGKSLLRVF
jgi:hypothetical protein